MNFKSVGVLKDTTLNFFLNIVIKNTKSFGIMDIYIFILHVKVVILTQLLTHCQYMALFCHLIYINYIIYINWWPCSLIFGYQRIFIIIHYWVYHFILTLLHSFLWNLLNSFWWLKSHIPIKSVNVLDTLLILMIRLKCIKKLINQFLFTDTIYFKHKDLLLYN